MLHNLLAYAAIGCARPQSIRRFLMLRKSQYWNAEKIRRIKERLLSGLLEYAYVHVPYYQRSLGPFKDCWRQGAFNWEIFQDIPVLEKEIVKKEFDRLQSDELRRLRVRENRSGGSTGVPTRHLQDEHFRQMDMAEDLLFKSWGGVRPGDRSLFIAADEKDYFGLRAGWKQRIGNRLFNKFYFNLFRLSESSCSEIVGLIRKEKPRYIQLYVSAAYEIAGYILSRKLSLPAPKMVMCIAGTVYPQMLDRIEQAFGCRAFSLYGSRETGAMAGFCQQRHYHEMSFTHHLEILDSRNRPVQAQIPGNVAVTVMSNRALPLVRYKIGDMALWGEKPCPCGIALRSIERIIGRSGEVFYNSKGKILLPEIFIHLFGVSLGDTADRIQRFQLIQHDFDTIEVKLVLAQARQEELSGRLNDLGAKIVKVMEEEVKVKFSFVAEIPPLPSGKFCYTISRLATKVSP